MTQSFRDVPVTLRGRPALAQARRKPNSDHVEVASIRFTDERDARGAPIQKTFSEAPTSEADKAYALTALADHERQDIFRQVRSALGGTK